MREFLSTVSSKGRVTIPTEVRRHLGVEIEDEISFVLTDDGKVELRPVRFSLDSVLGSIESLPDESMDLDREIEEARSADSR